MVVLLAALGVQVVREPRGPRRDGSHAEAWARRTTVLKHTTVQRCAPPSPSFRMGNTDARRSFSPVLALLAIPALLAAQLPQADEAFRRGDYAAARAGYERVLAADAYAARARAAAPLDRTARELERVVRAALRPEVATTGDGAGDSDDNTFVAQEGTLTASLGGQLRGTLHAGWRRAADPAGDGTSFGAGGYAIAALGGSAVLRAGLGARRVEPDVGPARTPLTAQLGLGLHPARYAAVSVGYSRTPFDETAALMRQALTLDAVDLSFDVSPVPGWSISGGGGGAWLSDGNRRYSAVGSVLGRAVRGLQIGPFARVLGYRRAAPGLYFAPDRFSVLEGRVVYQWQRSRWGLRAEGGLGSQQVFRGAAHQTAWHFGLMVSRVWGANNELALVGSITNSAGATSTTGTRTEAFRYRTLGLRFRQGL